MAINQATTDQGRSSSPKNYNPFLGRSSQEKNDIRKFLVVDRHYKKVGTICDIYYDYHSSTPLYIEIIPLNEKIERSIMYPYDQVKLIGKDGPAFISSTSKAVFDYEEYDFDHVMQTEGADLINFNQMLEADSRKYFSQFEYQNCA